MEQLEVGQLVIHENKLWKIIDKKNPLGFNEYRLRAVDGDEEKWTNRLRIDTVEIQEIELNDMLMSELSLNESMEVAGKEVYVDKSRNSPQKKRFAKVNEEEINAMRQERLSKATECQNRWAAKIFKDWLVNIGHSAEFEMLDTTSLDKLLQEFYCSVRNKNGEFYSKSALKGLRSGVQRYISSPPFNRNINIITDREFRGANGVYLGHVSKIRKSGKDQTQHKSTILKGDIEKLYKDVFTNTPLGLQRRVFFELLLHFGRRGREGLRKLNINTYQVCRDDKRVEYIAPSYNEEEKTRRGENNDGNEKESVMYSIPGSPDCPVENFKVYLSKLNEKQSALFQRPKDVYKGEEPCWYENKPLGKNKLDDMMKDMSKDGHLSKIYTNHCISKTCVVALDNAGFSPKDITVVTGHKSEQSITPYLGKPTQNKKKTLSKTLHDYCHVQEPENQESSMEFSAIENKENDANSLNAVEAQRSPPVVTGASCTATIQQPTGPTALQQQSLSGLFSGSFSNCTFNLQFN